MPLLRALQTLVRASERLAYSLQLTSAELFDAPAERIIARGHLLLCGLSLWAVYLDAAEPAARFGSSGYELLIAYSVFAAGLVALTSARMAAPLARVAIQDIDIVAVSGLLVPTGGSVLMVSQSLAKKQMGRCLKSLKER